MVLTIIQDIIVVLGDLLEVVGSAKMVQMQEMEPLVEIHIFIKNHSLMQEVVVLELVEIVMEKAGKVQDIIGMDYLKMDQMEPHIVIMVKVMEVMDMLKLSLLDCSLIINRIVKKPPILEVFY